MQIIDVSKSEGQLRIVGGALVLPTSAYNISDPMAGSLRWNPASGFVEFYNGSMWQAINLGGMTYTGTWNASTNTPQIRSGIGTKGDYYRVSVSGNTVIDGTGNWIANDYIVFDGTEWSKISGNDPLALSDLSDVTINDPVDGQILTYSGTSSAWTNTNVPYDIYGTFIGTPNENQVIWRIVFGRTVTFPAGLSGSVAIAEGAPDTSISLAISKNGTQIGSIDFAYGSTHASFTFENQVVFNAFDTLQINGPSPPDYVFYSPSWAFICHR